MRGIGLGRMLCWCFMFLVFVFVWTIPVFSMEDSGRAILSPGKCAIEINLLLPEKELIREGKYTTFPSNHATSPEALIACPSFFEQKVIIFVNQERSRVGLSPLEMDVRLLTAARMMSDDMASVSFVPSDHMDSIGRSFDVRVAEAGAYPYVHLGEVIAGGFATPKDVVQAWMNSPSHKARLLDEKYQHIGVGFTYDPGTAHWFYWAVDLGSTTEKNQLPSLGCESGFYNLFLSIIQK